MLNIEEDSLRDLIHRRSRSIKGFAYTIETGLSLAGFVLTVLSLDWDNLAFWKIVILAAFAAFYIFLFIHSFCYRYSDEAFYQDIVKLSGVHAFSLLVLKSSVHPGCYLLVKDKRWKTFLFPYLRTHKENDEQNIRHFIEHNLKIEKFQIISTKEKDIAKVSVSANLKKSYHHIFYCVEFDAVGTAFINKRAKVGGVTYRWLSINDMKCDKHLISRNAETVTFVESSF